MSFDGLLPVRCQCKRSDNGKGCKAAFASGVGTNQRTSTGFDKYKYLRNKTAELAALYEENGKTIGEATAEIEKTAYGCLFLTAPVTGEVLK
jgi:hypothetical protein